VHSSLEVEGFIHLQFFFLASSELGEVHGDFFNGSGMPTCQDGMVQAIEDKLSGHLRRLGKGAAAARLCAHSSSSTQRNNVKPRFSAQGA